MAVVLENYGLTLSELAALIQKPLSEVSAEQKVDLLEAKESELSIYWTETQIKGDAELLAAFYSTHIFYLLLIDDL
jgi:hypothetical protein